jgi:hypothetical protein
MVRKNYGPCSIRNCNNKNSRFRQFTPLAYNKAKKNGTYKYYTYLRVGEQLCHIHYMQIVEADRNKKLEIQGNKILLFNFHLLIIIFY